MPYPQPVCNVPVVYTWPAPVTSPVTATAQSPPRAAAVLAAPGARVKTFLYKGKTYQAIQTDERGESEEMELRKLSPSLTRVRVGDGEHFAGMPARLPRPRLPAPVESFASPGALLDSILKGVDPGINDQVMRQKLNASAPRAGGAANVTVTAFLYATKKVGQRVVKTLVRIKAISLQAGESVVT